MTIVIIQARLASTRLPRKILLPMADGRPMLDHVAERAKQIKGVDRVVVACPWSDYLKLVDDGADYAKVYAPGVDPNDVLARFAAVAESEDADTIIRLTADCPFLDPDVASLVLQRFHQESADFATNDTSQSGYPDGWDVQVCTRALLDKLDQTITDPFHREHVFTAVNTLLGVRTVLVRKPGQPDTRKLSIDTFDDYERLTGHMNYYSS